MVLVPLLASGLAVAEQTALSPYQGCWTTTISESKTTNRIELCIVDALLELAIYYPNDDREPTTCETVGFVALDEQGTLQLKTRRGGCKNGRALGEATLACTLNGADELHCLHPNFELLHLFRSTPGVELKVLSQQRDRDTAIRELAND